MVMVKYLWLVALLLSAGVVLASEAESPAYLPLAGVPPSPSTASGERIWPDPQLTHWPAIMYNDESRNVALRIPYQQGGLDGHMGWHGQTPVPFTLPEAGEQTSGLVSMPTELGVYQLQVAIAADRWQLGLRVVAVNAAEWPHARLREGFPVDADGRAVVVRLQRDAGQGDRRWQLLRAELPTGSGPVLWLGDPLQAMGRGVFPESDTHNEVHAFDEAYAHHAALLALAQAQTQRPRAVVWSPGNAALEQRRWNQEELRLLEVVNQRFLARGISPLRVLLLPPVPIAEVLHEYARERRHALRYHAANHGWLVVDAERIVGGNESASELAPGLHTRYPQGEAQERLRQRLHTVLAE